VNFFKEKQNMKSLRFMLSVLLMSLSTVAFAQSDAQKSFDKLKTLEGVWEGPVTTIPPVPEMKSKSARVTIRVTSMGHAIMHELKPSDMPDNPITMLYRDEDRLLLTHYCDAGNRPRMTGKMSPDGKTVAFDFLDVAGGTQYGHMHNAEFTPIDDNHHIEEWTYMMKDDKPIRARFELRRVK
jgi:hypothetical protein